MKSKLDVRKLAIRSHRLSVRSWSLLLTSIFYILTSLSTRAQTLQDYQELAMTQNPSIQAKYKEFEAAMQRVTQVRGLPDPTLSISAFGRMTETRVGPQMARFTLSQMFPWFGTLKAQGDVSTLMAEASFQAYIDEQNKLKFQVAKVYYPLAEVDQLLVHQKENLSQLKFWKTLATSKYENGETSLADVLRVDLMIQEQETEIDLLDKMKQPLRVTFNNLLNRADTLEVQLVDDLEVDLELLSMEQDWDEHPLIQELQLKIKSKEKQVSVIEKQSLPQFGVGIDYIIVAERTDMNVPQNGQDAIMPMVSVSLPIFRKKYNAALSETRLQTEGYELMAQATRNELSTGFENLKYDIQKERLLAELYARQIAETKQIQTLLLSEFSNSGKDLIELLRIQMQLLNYQILQVKSKTRLLTALSNIQYLTAKSK
jgi:outer membrane protein, heavy metal efflux system